MRCDRNLDQHIAGGPTAPSGAAAAFQSDLLTVLQADRNFHIELFAVGQHHAARSAARRFLEAHGHRDGEILSSTWLLTATATAQSAEKIAEQIFGAEALSLVAVLGPAEIVIARAATGATAERVTAAMRTRIEAARIAGFVDLAGVELRTLVLVTDNVVGAADLLELFLCGVITRVLVGMILFGERAEGLFDVGLARGF